jgi:hypothetical protein
MSEAVAQDPPQPEVSSEQSDASAETPNAVATTPSDHNDKEEEQPSSNQAMISQENAET